VTLGIAGEPGAAFKSERDTTKFADVSVAPEEFLAVKVTTMLVFTEAVGTPLVRGVAVDRTTASLSTKEPVVAFHVYFQGFDRSAALSGIVITVDPPREAELTQHALIFPEPS